MQVTIRYNDDSTLTVTHNGVSWRALSVSCAADAAGRTLTVEHLLDAPETAALEPPAATGYGYLSGKDT